MTTTQATDVEHLDVAIIGAGISGIGAARYITHELASRSVAIFEGRENIGGTWDLFRYPGIRSDSDLHTFGYEFKPWRHESAIADAPLIREYLAEAIDENNLAGVLCLSHRVVSADWSSATGRWLLTIAVTDSAGSTTTKQVTANWIFAATGYYNYEEGYTPQFEGRDTFEGLIVHPQHWPKQVDYKDKKVVVIGSGATAVTMVPAMLNGTQAAKHVTMLQRTPTYIMSLPRVDRLALRLMKLLGEKRGYAATRFKNIWIERAVVEGLRAFPRAGRRLIRRLNTKRLPAGFDVDKHFNPPYDPWDQRLCLTPNGDFFRVIRNGQASVVTDSIARFTRTGLELTSGERLDADIIVTATGLNLRLFGGIAISVDDEPIDVAESVVYRGMLLSGIPNWALAIGYTTSSWTLKVGLMCRYFIELIRYMDHNGYDQARAIAEPDTERRPVMDLQSGYALRGAKFLPKQGTKAPWRMAMSYHEDAKALRGPVFDEHLEFARTAKPSRTSEPIF